MNKKAALKNFGMIETVLRPTGDEKLLQALDLVKVAIEESKENQWAILKHLKSSGDDESSKASRLKSLKGQFKIPHEMSSSNPLGLMRFALYTDGACRGNPGPGAWGSIGLDHEGKEIFEASGVEMLTTNNKMELEAVIQGMERFHLLCQERSLASGQFEIHLYADSRYVIDGLEQWIPGWKARGWKKADNKSPENLELWQKLDMLCAGPFRPLCHWVKGHDGHPQNEYCDTLANRALDEAGF